MGFLTLRCHSSAVVLSSVALALVLPLLAHGNGSAEGGQDGRGGLDSGGGDATLPELSKTYVCGGEPIDNQRSKNMVLTAISGMKFKCATSLTLGPASEDNSFASVYAFKADTSTCDTEKPTTLDSLVTGAKLVKSVQAKPASGSDPFYTLTYTNAPEQAQTLCYTCNTNSELNLKLRAAQASPAECTILIKVNAKTSPEGPNGETPPDVGSTRPPTATSGAGAVKASAATGAIGLLLAVSRL